MKWSASVLGGNARISFNEHYWIHVPSLAIAEEIVAQHNKEVGSREESDKRLREIIVEEITAWAAKPKRHDGNLHPGA